MLPYIYSFHCHLCKLIHKTMQSTCPVSVHASTHKAGQMWSLRCERHRLKQTVWRCALCIGLCNLSPHDDNIDYSFTVACGAIGSRGQSHSLYWSCLVPWSCWREKNNFPLKLKSVQERKHAQYSPKPHTHGKRLTIQIVLCVNDH